MLWDWVCVKEPDGLREEAPPKFFAIMLQKRLPDGSKMKRRTTEEPLKNHWSTKIWCYTALKVVPLWLRAK